MPVWQRFCNTLYEIEKEKLTVQHRGGSRKGFDGFRFDKEKGA